MADFLDTTKSRPVLPNIKIPSDLEVLDQDYLSITKTNEVKRTSFATLVALINRVIPSGLLEAITPDVYHGARLKPIGTTYNGFHITKSVAGLVGISAENISTSTTAQTSITVKGAGAIYTNYGGMSYYGANYVTAFLRDTFMLFSTKTLRIATANSNPIEFRTSTTEALDNATTKLTIKATGIINVNNAPIYATDVDAGTGGLVVGDIYKTATGELRIKL